MYIPVINRIACSWISTAYTHDLFNLMNDFDFILEIFNEPYFWLGVYITQIYYLKLFIKNIVSKQKVYLNRKFKHWTTIKYKSCIIIIQE